MDRRTLLKCAPLAPAILLAGCGGSKPVRGWVVPPLAPGEDFRMRLLRYAVLAPNSHNAQPWLLDLRVPSVISLYLDPGRLLPCTDPYARQAHISLGAFLETLDIAARQSGYQAAFEYFPEGQSAAGRVLPKPVARVSLAASPSVSKDPLFGSILARHTNKLPFDPQRPVPDSVWPALESETLSASIAWRRVTSGKSRRALTGMLKDAMAIEVSSRERNQETARWFRFSDAEFEAGRDGFGLAQSGASGLKKWVIERFVLNRTRAADPEGVFARSAVRQTEEQAASAPAFAALVTATNTRLDQLLVGRAYARLHLAATRLGLQVHPFSQPLQEYPEMLDLQSSLKSLLAVHQSHTIQMLFRLGYAAPAPPPPRRDPLSLLRRHQGGHA